LLVLTGTLAFAQQGLQALYDGALQEFRAGSLAEAARLFEQFRTVAPEDDKADDALWYIDRALAGLGRQESWKN
jgi:TolA-binding protein